MRTTLVFTLMLALCPLESALAQASRADDSNDSSDTKTAPACNKADDQKDIYAGNGYGSSLDGNDMPYNSDPCYRNPTTKPDQSKQNDADKKYHKRTFNTCGGVRG